MKLFDYHAFTVAVVFVEGSDGAPTAMVIHAFKHGVTQQPTKLFQHHNRNVVRFVSLEKMPVVAAQNFENQGIPE